MPEEKAPQLVAFLPASLMYFYSGKPMHFCSGVDILTLLQCDMPTSSG
jgi:hypothetical protein